MVALGFERFEVRINNRLVLNGLLEELGLADKTVPILRVLDKLPKVGPANVRRELIGVSEEDAKRILEPLEEFKTAFASCRTDQEVTAQVERLGGLLLARLQELGFAYLQPFLTAAIGSLAAGAQKRSGEQPPGQQLQPSPPLLERVRRTLRDGIVGVGITPDQADKVLALSQAAGSNTEVLERVGRDFGGNEKVALGIRQLRELLDVAKTAGVPEGRLKLDLSIARGLDYYTGTIYETFLLDLPGIGSVCSGGRYDNLAGLYTKQHLPGVGASLGLDRLLSAMEELNLLPKTSTPAPALVVQFVPERLGDYQRLARSLRAQDIGTEVFPEAKKLAAQLKYAEGRGFRVALIAGPDEFATGVWKVKDLARREETAVAEADVAARVRAVLGG
jgi:histidyl-tRNA synthetase